MTMDNRDYQEIALFAQVGAASVSFAFDLTDRAQRSAFRLVALSDHLDGRDGSAPDPATDLIDPVRSFLDDVTNGPPGVNGRPLLMLASDEPPDCPARAVKLVRPACWKYHFEGRPTQLRVPDAKREIDLRLRDSFCVFESGRIFYVLTLVQVDGAPSLDEYALLQMQQLILDKALARDPAYLGFRREGDAGAPLSLVDFAAARLARLDHGEMGGARSAVTSLLKPFGLVLPARVLGDLGTGQFTSLCLGVEDDKLWKAARHSVHSYDRTRRDPPPVRPDDLIALETGWKRKTAKAGKAAHGDEAPAEAIARADLVVAGLATGVPDFPFQDKSEVHDSTRPASESVESVLFTRPQLMLEIGEAWRSFREGLRMLGTCPYLYLTWMVAIHDEKTVVEMELMVEDLIYDPTGQQRTLPWSERARTQPLSDVMQLLESSSSLFGQNTAVQERNLRRRLELFRWESIHRCGNVFRYPKEKAALNAVRANLGIDDRFGEVHRTLDRLENLVDDVSMVARSYSARRTNRLLFVLALLGLISLPKSISEAWRLWLQPAEKSWPGGIAFFLMGAVIALLLAGIYATGRGKRSGP